MDHAPKHRLAELPRRSVRDISPDMLARIFDGTPHLEPEVVRRQREFVVRASILERRVGFACLAISAFVVLYFLGQLARAVLSWA